MVIQPSLLHNKKSEILVKNEIKQKTSEDKKSENSPKNWWMAEGNRGIGKLFILEWKSEGTMDGESGDSFI